MSLALTVVRLPDVAPLAPSRIYPGFSAPIARVGSKIADQAAILSRSLTLPQAGAALGVTIGLAIAGTWVARGQYDRSQTSKTERVAEAQGVVPTSAELRRDEA